MGALAAIASAQAVAYRYYGQAATWSPVGGGGGDVTLLFDEPDKDLDYQLGGRKVTTVRTARVRVSEIAVLSPGVEIQRGDLFVIAASDERLQVSAKPGQLDQYRTEWTFDLAPA